MTTSMPDQTTTASQSATSDRIERLLQSPLVRWLAVLLVVAAAIVAGVLRGLPEAVLVLACGMLLLVISLLWNSLQGLTGESAISLQEALGLGAPSAEEEQKRAVLRALKDLEYERSVGKISEEDYAELTARYRTEARALLRSLDENLAPNRAQAEKLLERRLAAENLDGKRRRRRADKNRKHKEPAPETVEDESAPEPDAAEAKATTAPAQGRADETDREAVKSTTPVPRAPTRRCEDCETRNDLDARFCKGCGASMAPEGKRLCGACPAVYEDSLDACPDCGVPREDT